ncbi:phage head closure protein [Xanthomonas arboricola]|uniref:phage head closure protein n=1 Tax=Xanthomonas arboricola TaxID=56448 RepID=UPI0019D133F6|nr:phage head closure protein [Xanthomonas arboricola]
MSNIAAGKLRHRIRIEKQVTARDDDGVQSTTWQPVHAGTLAAAIEPVSAREFIAAGAGQGEVSARITIRYRAGILASMRAVHVRNGADAEIYNIQGALADRESGLEYLTLPVSTGTNDGQ